MSMAHQPWISPHITGIKYIFTNNCNVAVKVFVILWSEAHIWYRDDTVIWLHLKPNKITFFKNDNLLKRAIWIFRSTWELDPVGTVESLLLSPSNFSADDAEPKNGALFAEHHSFLLQFTSNDFIFLLMHLPPSPTSGLKTILPFNGTLIVFHVHSQPTGQQPLLIGWFFQGQFRGYHE